MDRQRIIFISLFILTSIVLAFAIYWVFFRNKTPQNQDINTVNTDTNGGSFPTIQDGNGTRDTVSDLTLPDIADINIDQTNNTAINNLLLNPNGGPIERTLVEKVTDVDARYMSLDKTNDARFYNNQDGKFYRVNADGSVSAMSEQVFYNVDKVTWSPQNNESIIEYPDGKNLYYNFDSSKQVTLPDHWEEFSFAQNGSRIAAKSIGLGPENTWLISSNPDGENPKPIEAMGSNANKVVVDWSPNNQVIALSRTGEAMGADRQEVLLIGQNKENFKSLIVEGYGLESQWSPHGEKLLHSVYNTRNDYKPELWIVSATPDSAGQNRKPLGVNTWSHKCTMVNERFAYCAVPDTLEPGAGFAPEIADTTPDTLFKIDTQTGAKSIVALDDIYTIENIQSSEDGKKLFFTDTLKTGIFEVTVN